MKKNPEYVHALMDYAVEIGKCMVDYYDACGMDIIAPVDPLISQISPKKLHRLYGRTLYKAF